MKNQLFFLFENNSIIGNNSSLPQSIPKLKTNLDRLLKFAKFDILKHNPTFANVQNVALIVVSKENLSKATIKIIIKIKTMYICINVFVFFTVSSDTFFPSNLINNEMNLK